MFFSEPALVVNRGEAPTFAVIWLHGLGADGSDFVPVIGELGLPATLSGRFIFPHAPWRAVTCNGGYEMRAWYDILALAPGRRQINEDDLAAACVAVQALIDAEIAAGIPAERIILAGFSQGGAVAYATALRSPQALAGVAALSTYLPLAISGEPALRRDLALFAAHGDADDVVAPALGQAAYQQLCTHGVCSAEWHAYPMAHQVCLEEIRVLGQWLCRQLRA